MCEQEVCEPFHLQLLPNPNFAQTDLASLVLGADIAYVYGGNTKSMMAVWREWGVLELLRQAWEQGTVLAGGSGERNLCLLPARPNGSCAAADHLDESRILRISLARAAH